MNADTIPRASRPVFAPPYPYGRVILSFTLFGSAVAGAMLVMAWLRCLALVVSLAAAKQGCSSCSYG